MCRSLICPRSNAYQPTGFMDNINLSIISSLSLYFKNSHTKTAGMAEEISPQQRQTADYLIPIFIAAILLSIPFVICVTSTCKSHRTITRTNRTTYTHATLPVPRYHNPRRTDQGLDAQLFDLPPPLYGHHHQDIELDPIEPHIGSVSPS